MGNKGGITMYAICSVKKDDVLKAVETMKRNGYKLPVFQFSGKKYKELERNQAQVIQMCQKVQSEAIYVINLNTKRLHRKTCGKRGQNIVGARLANPKTTGLKLCSNCMK